ncbi:MAG: hypothetical protein VX738_13600 [Planctomycetota bacterium]|nr:hypothetical protein [Planctomycetota bacterium]
MMFSKFLLSSTVLATITMFITVNVDAIGPRIQYSKQQVAKKRIAENPAEPAVLHQAPNTGHAARVTPTPATLFYNYYAPTQGGGIPAAIYPAPRQVPPIVGHTYNTYQPLMPHEFMYRHYRAYHHYYNNGMGFTRTSVRYK